MKITDLHIEGTFHGEHLGGDEWRLDEPITFAWTEDGAVKGQVVPKGYLTDRSSIPRRLRGIVQKDGPHNRASILHDWLYEHRSVPRADADRLFKAFMKYDATGWWRRNLIWSAVRVFGGAIYRT